MDWMEVIVIVLAIVGSNVWLHRDIAALRERMAKLEGKVDVLTSNVGTVMGSLFNSKVEQP